MSQTTREFQTNRFALDYDMIVVIDLGSQIAQAVTRHIRANQVYSEIWPEAIPVSKFTERNVKGVVLAGGHESASRAGDCEKRIAPLGIPVLTLVGYSEPGDEPEDRVRDFALNTCDCSPKWTMDNFVKSATAEIRKQVGDDAVVCGLSGGVDSAVAASLVYGAIGDQLTTIFVDHGLLRKGEAEHVAQTFSRRFGSGFVMVDAGARFLRALTGVNDPEAKRKIIGSEFIQVFEEKAREAGNVRHLVQGTLYTDVIESGVGGTVIKSHHNVGGLPEHMDLQLLEPLNSLFKDEVRALGETLGLPQEIVWRQPFPGPGLAIRVMGALDAEKISIVRESDAILFEELTQSGCADDVWQYFTAVLDTRAVGVLDGERTYGYVVAVRAVTSHDGTTAQWARLPHDVLDRISNRMMHEIPGVSRVVYDISSKPPATIEWE